MGELRLPEQVLPICAITSRHAEGFDWALLRYESIGFDAVVKSEVFRFDMTDYYNTEMGEQLSKQFVAFGPLRNPEELADWKLESNRMEGQYKAAGDFEEKRPLNLDPGYVTLAKLVLATTKDRDHRIYLRDAIFAEVTLSFTRGIWKAHPWSYPDYQTDYATDFLNAAREKMKVLFREELH